MLVYRLAWGYLLGGCTLNKNLILAQGKATFPDASKATASSTTLSNAWMKLIILLEYVADLVNIVTKSHCHLPILKTLLSFLCELERISYSLNRWRIKVKGLLLRVGKQVDALSQRSEWVCKAVMPSPASENAWIPAIPKSWWYSLLSQKEKENAEERCISMRLPNLYPFPNTLGWV